MRLYSASVMDSLPLVNGEYESRMETENLEIAQSLGAVIVHRFDASVIDRRTTFRRSRASSRDAPA